jgi:hypothetical protein
MPVAEMIVSTKVNATRIVQVPCLPVNLAGLVDGLLDTFKDKIVQFDYSPCHLRAG